MKKLVCLFVLCLTAVSLQAQGQMSYSLELVAGVGVGKGPQYAVTPEFVAQYQWDSGFRTGLGAGIRYARPVLDYTVKNGKHTESSFCNEGDIPVFLRFGYGREKLFVNLDAGYAFALLSLYGAGWTPNAEKAPSYNGLFCEPQFGWKLGQHSSFALGVLLQQSTLMDHTVTESGTFGSSDYSETDNGIGHTIFTPAITLRYGFLF